MENDLLCNLCTDLVRCGGNAQWFEVRQCSFTLDELSCEYGPKCQGTTLSSPWDIRGKTNLKTACLEAHPQPHFPLCQTKLWHVNLHCVRKKKLYSKLFYIPLLQYVIFYWLISNPCWPFLAKEGFTDNAGASPSVEEAYVRVQLIGVDPILKFYLEYWFYEECHRGGCILDGLFLYKHYWPGWHNKPPSCYFLL